MPAVNSYHFLLGPLVAAAALGIIVLICRWVFSTDHRQDGVGEPSPARDYGLLVALTTVRTREDADMLQGLLAEAGIRASVSGELEVLVFGKDLSRARQLVSAP